MTVTYSVDPDRSTDIFGETGILVRAKDAEGQWVNADIVTLDIESLNSWLRSRGGENTWAESVVRILLGHREEYERDRPQ